MTEKKANIHSAILELRKEVEPILADRTNPMYGRDYATISQINKTLDPLFAKYGLTFVSSIAKQEETWGVISILTHVESNTFLTSFFPTERLGDPQQIGKLLTYARRYNLAGLLNLSFADDKDDDDGNSFVTPPKAPVKRIEPKPLNMAAL